MKNLQQLDEYKTMLFRISGDLRRRLPSPRWAPIPLRLIVGYGFMEHGFAKLGRGSELVRGNPPRDWRARSAFHGLG